MMILKFNYDVNSLSNAGFSTFKDQVFSKYGNPNEQLSHFEFPATSHKVKKQCDITREQLCEKQWLNDTV